MASVRFRTKANDKTLRRLLCWRICINHRTKVLGFQTFVFLKKWSLKMTARNVDKEGSRMEEGGNRDQKDFWGEKGRSDADWFFLQKKSFYRGRIWDRGQWWEERVFNVTRDRLTERQVAAQGDLNECAPETGYNHSPSRMAHKDAGPQAWDLLTLVIWSIKLSRLALAHPCWIETGHLLVAMWAEWRFISLELWCMKSVLHQPDPRQTSCPLVPDRIP